MAMNSIKRSYRSPNSSEAGIAMTTDPEVWFLAMNIGEKIA